MIRTNKKKFLTDSNKIWLYSLIFFLIVFVQMPIGRVEAQSNWWSVPETIPLYDPETWPPILLADQNRTVHAFSSQWIDDADGSIRAIVYNQWSLEQGWTYPIDIILSPNKEARLTDVHLDENGIFHIVFWGGDNTKSDIYYSKAPIEMANNAQAWSKPIIIGKNAGDPEGAVFIEFNQETMHVIYFGQTFGNGLYVVSSLDGGETWSDPKPMFLANNDEPNISNFQVVVDNSGQFHAIWGVYNVFSQGRGIYYTKSNNGETWSEPILLTDAKEGSLGTQAPTIIAYEDTIIALYITHINQKNKIVMQRSHDGGQTWDTPSIIFSRHEGVNGSLSLVIDGNNDLHLFFGQRIPGSPDIHGMWHTTFVNNRWLKPVAIIRGPKIDDRIGYNSFDPVFARAIVSQGNKLLVTWRTSIGSIGNGVWFSYKVLNLPESPISFLPTHVVDTNPLASINTFTAIAEPTSTPRPIKLDLDNPDRHRMDYSANRSMPIFIASMSLIVFLMVLFLLIRLNRNIHR